MEWLHLFQNLIFDDFYRLSSSELDALGDELLLDDDSSYLDEAATAPSIPEGVPGDRSTNRVQKKQHFLVSYFVLPLLFLAKSCFCCFRMASWWMSLAFLRFLLHKEVIPAVLHVS